jgi:hypothetical protein
MTVSFGRSCPLGMTEHEERAENLGTILSPPGIVLVAKGFKAPPSEDWTGHAPGGSSQACFHHSCADQDFFQCLLLPYGAIPVFATALKETMTHHALAEQKENDRQDSYKQEPSNSERGWLSSVRGRRTHLLSSLRLLWRCANGCV